MDDTPAAEFDSDTFTIKRRNSIPSPIVVPTHTNGHHQQSPSLLSISSTDFELLPLKSPSDSYTSLKDLIAYSPSSIMSPTPSSSAAAVPAAGNGGSGYEISIRNRLVKQAAWAYLQPTTIPSSSPTSRGVFFTAEIAGVRRYVAELVTRVYDWLVDALWLILCR